MKINLPGLTLLLLAQIGYGQIDKGRGLLTGSVNGSVNHTTYNRVKTNQYQALASVSYGSFVRNNLLVGADISAGFSQTKSEEIAGYKATYKAHCNAGSIAPFVRYYWP